MNKTVTFEYGGATFEVRTQTQAQHTQFAYLLSDIGIQLGLVTRDTTSELINKLPFSYQFPLIRMCKWLPCTRITGASVVPPIKFYPLSNIEAHFIEWLNFYYEHDELIEQWASAFDEVNPNELGTDDPLSETAESGATTPNSA